MAILQCVTKPHNTILADLDQSARSLDLDKSRFDGSGDKTLTNISQSTLNFILDEQQNVLANTKPVTPQPANVKADLNANASGEPAPSSNPVQKPVEPEPSTVNPTATVTLVKEEQEPARPAVIANNASDSIISIDSSTTNNRSNDNESNLSSTSAASLIDLDDTTISIVGSSEEGIYNFFCFYLTLMCTNIYTTHVQYRTTHSITNSIKTTQETLPPYCVVVH